MNSTVRIRPFYDSLFSGSESRFSEFSGERMRVFFSAVMPLLMSCGLIVGTGIRENKRMISNKLNSTK